MTVAYITSGATYPIPGTLTLVETIAGGAASSSSNSTVNEGTGGGAGAYNANNNATFLGHTGTVNVQAGPGGSADHGNGNDTWFNATSLANAVTNGNTVSVASQQGAGSTTAGGAGGTGSSGVGTSSANGGSGGLFNQDAGANGGGDGGGGAGGPNGAGLNGGSGSKAANDGGGGGGGTGSPTGTAGGDGTTTTGGTGGKNSAGSGQGTGGTTGSPAGGAGSNGGGGGGAEGTTAVSGGAGGAGADWDATHGPGGGGGGGPFNNTSTNKGGVGGNYGAGGGGPGGQSNTGFSAGAQGIIRVSYTGGYSTTLDAFFEPIRLKPLRTIGFTTEFLQGGFTGTSPKLANPYVQAPLFEPTKLKPATPFDWSPFGTDPPLTNPFRTSAFFEPNRLKPTTIFDWNPPGTSPALAVPYRTSNFFDPTRIKPPIPGLDFQPPGTSPAINSPYWTQAFFDAIRLKQPTIDSPPIIVPSAAAPAFVIQAPFFDVTRLQPRQDFLWPPPGTSPALISAYVPGALFDRLSLMRPPAWDSSVTPAVAAATCNLTIDGSASHNSGATSTPTVGPLSSTFANGRVIIFVTYNLSSGSISSITGGGLTFTKRITITLGGSDVFDEWAAPVGGSPLSGVTFTANLSGSASFTFMQAFVVSNGGNAVAFDTGGPQAVTSGAASMTTNESAMVFCAGRFGTSGAPTASAPWTQIIGGVASSFSASEYQFPLSAGTYTGAFSGTDETGSIIDAIYCPGASAAVASSLASFFEAPTLKRPGVEFAWNPFGTSPAIGTFLYTSPFFDLTKLGRASPFEWSPFAPAVAVSGVSLTGFFDPTKLKPAGQFDWNPPGTSPALTIPYLTTEWFERVRLKLPIIHVPDIVPPMPGVFINLDTWFDALRVLRPRLWDMDLPPAFTVEAPPPTAPFFDALRKTRVPDDFPFTRATVQLDTRLYALTDWFTAVRLKQPLVETPLVVYFPAQFIPPASAFTFPFIANMGSLTNR